jgi:hypothetical protein
LTNLHVEIAGMAVRLLLFCRPPAIISKLFLTPRQAAHGPVAQLDRVFDYESKGRGFESRRAHQANRHPFGCLFACASYGGIRTREGWSRKENDPVWSFLGDRAREATTEALACAAGGESRRAHHRRRGLYIVRGDFYCIETPLTRSVAPPLASKRVSRR